MGHHIENTGDTPLRFLEMFKSSYHADVLLDTIEADGGPRLTWVGKYALFRNLVREIEGKQRCRSIFA
jgi:oxalate decarboxylase/phosphoglucose isomerase-like protein (cupin superfamily)